jgi:putative transposase
VRSILSSGGIIAVCFYCDEDYAFYLQKLKEASEKYHVKVHAFVLMTNHVHLVTPSDAEGVPRMMQSLGRCYVLYVNITYSRTGTLWEGRYKSCLVASDDYLLTVSRYIELNPVRARMVNLPGEYPWSSYRHNAMGIKIGLISEHQIYQELGATPSSRLLAYRQLFESQLPASLLDEIRLCTNKEWVVGRSDFIMQIEAAVGRKVYERQWGGDRRPRKDAQEL